MLQEYQPSLLRTTTAKLSALSNAIKKILGEFSCYMRFEGHVKDLKRLFGVKIITKHLSLRLIKILTTPLPPPPQPELSIEIFSNTLLTIQTACAANAWYTVRSRDSKTLTRSGTSVDKTRARAIGRTARRTCGIAI